MFFYFFKFTLKSEPEIIKKKFIVCRKLYRIKINNIILEFLQNWINQRVAIIYWHKPGSFNNIICVVVESK